MAALQDLIEQITDPILRERIQQEVDKLTKNKKFGLVFEEHIPEVTALYGVPVQKGCLAMLKNDKVDKTIYTVIDISGDHAVCVNQDGTNEPVVFAVHDIVRVAQFGQPIYPYLQQVDSVCNAPDSDLWHTLIEADNYHALQLLTYLYEGKVDCIYIDPPYNTGARDWKYNNDYVDSNDQYRHSKWLSMMEKRLKLAKKLLNPDDSVLIVTIDEKEYLHLGCLLEEMFPNAKIQMVSCCINPGGVSRVDEFSRTDEYIFFVKFGKSAPCALPLGPEWLGNIKRTNKGKARWDPLLRRGTSSMRVDCPNLFYPVFVSEDGSHFVGVGDPINLNQNRNEIVPPNGCKAIWPIHLDGSEGRWQVGKETLISLQKNHFVKLGKFTDRGMAIYYMKRGEQNKVANGEYTIVGINEDNSYDLNDDDYVALSVPSTQWSISAHNASSGGSSIIRKILKGQRFTFPKSLYSEYDAIRFFVANKPDALILDFFAGSGTTLHAVNLLNAEDGGHRRCIIVTNNEVSESEEKTLTEQGYHQGDPEWEKYGVARYVTWPRTVCSIEGHDINGKQLEGNYGIETDVYEPDDEIQVVSQQTGKPIKKTVYRKTKRQMYPKLADINMADGFKANAVYFKLGFLDKDSVALGRQFRELLPVFWMKAGCIGPCPSIDSGKNLPQSLVLSENGFAVLLDHRVYEKFVEQVSSDDRIQTVYIVTDSEPEYKSMLPDFNGKETYQIYRDYLDNFRINTGDRL